MKYNLIPPLLTRKEDLVKEDLPKVQSKHPTKHHDSMHFLDEDPHMPLRLNGFFSHFPSEKLSVTVLNDYDNKTS